MSPRNGCSGLLTEPVCVERGVPAGHWTYAVEAVVGADWRSDRAVAGTIRVSRTEQDSAPRPKAEPMPSEEPAAPENPEREPAPEPEPEVTPEPDPAPEPELTPKPELTPTPTPTPTPTEEEPSAGVAVTGDDVLG